MTQQRIINADVRETMKNIPSESVDCVMTSPPYWALRDYGIEPSVWDGKEDCEHEWGISVPPRRNGHIEDVKNPNSIQYSNVGSQHELTDTQSCSICQAWKGSLGLEPNFDLYTKHLLDIFDEIKRVLKKTGTCWVNLGDTYGGSGNASGHTNETKNLSKKTEDYGASKGNQKATKGLQKSLCLIPERFAIGMVERGWILRNTVIWYKPNSMPSSAKDRFTVDFEKIFFFTKSKKYFFEQQLEPHADTPFTRERYKYAPSPGKKHDDNKDTNITNTDFAQHWGNPQGRNKRCVWKICPQPFPEAHFAVFPENLVETPLKAGCPPKGTVLDPFMGSGTVLVVARKLGYNAVGIEIKKEYCDMAKKRLEKLPVSLERFVEKGVRE